ncbi:hypothetical protein Bca4012_019807 [Brassica carinata]
MLLTTTSFVLFSLFPLLQPSYCSCHLCFCWCYVAEPRRGGEMSDNGAASLHHHLMLESSQSTIDLHRYHLSRTKPPTPRPERMRSSSTLACAQAFFSPLSVDRLSLVLNIDGYAYGTNNILRIDKDNV